MFFIYFRVEGDPKIGNVTLDRYFLTNFLSTGEGEGRGSDTNFPPKSAEKNINGGSSFEPRNVRIASINGETPGETLSYQR